MQVGGGREFALENRLQPAVELSGLEAGSQERNSGQRSSRNQSWRRLLILGDDDRRKGKRKETGHDAGTVRLGQRREVGDLRLAKNLEPFRHEPLDVTGEGEPRARHVGIRDLTIEPGAIADVDNVQRLAAAFQELRNSDGTAHTRLAFSADGPRSADLLLARNFRIWEVSRSIAIVSAGP